MAYVALVSLAQTIDQILNHDQYPISFPGNQEIISICDHAIFLQAFLEDFPEKAISLEGRITEVANKAEDTIEYFISEKIRSHSGSIKSTVGPSKFKFKRQLRKIAEEMKSIVGEVRDIRDSATIKDVRLNDSPAASSSSTLAPSGEKDMVGFDDDIMAIMDWLDGPSFKLQILSIVGMGGIGKTTLARNIYDNLVTMSHIDICAWVTVSHDYSLEEILSGLLVSMGEAGEEISGWSNEIMAQKVYRTLAGRRYLIIMDDVWSTMYWDYVKMIFPDDHSGSRIMLTTRLFDVAASFGHFYEMHLMDDDQSWNLLRQKVFGHEACPDELEDVGKEIARSCRGLPLSIVITAELLSTIRQTRASWEAIAENVISAVATKDGQYEMMLSSSYTHLPHHLRPCLLYMGAFPKDYKILVSELIKLWIAESFVKPNESKTFEQVAQEYLEDLVKRSLVLVTSWKSNGKIKSCSLHDVVWEFCIRKVQEEKFLLPVIDYLPSVILRRYFLPQILKNQRRISVTSYDLDLKETIYYSPIRTIICIPHRGYWSKGSVQNFRLLRVFHVVHKNEDWDWEPGQVLELIHLRYLASNIPFWTIPAAISKLQNLQTLIIYQSEVRLPVEIWRLPQLRHLIAFSFHPLPYPKGATFPLDNLQTLSLVTNFVCSESILEMFPNLTKFGICYSGDKFDEDYHLDNLQHLHQLENLKLEIHKDFPLGLNLNPVFPALLKKLTLSGCRLPWEDMMSLGSLPNLEVLKLRDLAFQGDEWETIEGEFLQLKFLLIDESDLRYWVTKGIHFPRLEHLLLHRCPYLRKIPSDFGDIMTLKLIEVDDQNESLLHSAILIEEEQLSFGNYFLQVHVKQL